MPFHPQWIGIDGFYYLVLQFAFGLVVLVTVHAPKLQLVQLGSFRFGLQVSKAAECNQDTATVWTRKSDSARDCLLVRSKGEGW
jgi:hypothetical protein